jgi:hypothetical protein
LKRQYAKRLLEEMQHIQREQEQKLQLEADRKRVLAAKIRNALHVEEAEYQRRKAEIELKWSQMTDNNSHEYRSLLSQMNQKLDARPCMFERVTAEEARKHVQQLVSSTLKSKGVK